jgi:aminomethyltransferase
MLKRTPLYELHRELGARLVEFAGWEMPVQYSGVIEEVRAVREAAGLFDVSHMGEFAIEGPGALAWLNGMTTNDVARLRPGRAQYSLLCAENGGILDDILLYQVGDESYLMVVNAANTDADYEWLEQHRVAGVTIEDISDEIALIAVQGPESAALVGRLTEAAVPSGGTGSLSAAGTGRAVGRPTPAAALWRERKPPTAVGRGGVELASLRRFGFAEGHVAGVECMIARTGYTGEDGFELFTREAPDRLWRALMAAGGAAVKPCGLGARDVLRLEAGNVLYGHEIGPEVNPLVAGLDWVVKPAKGPFMGSEAIAAVAEAGPPYRLVGLEMQSRAIPRQGYAIIRDGETVGEVTSGTFSPTLNRPIGLGYVPTGLAEPGTQLSVEVRGRHEPAKIVGLPFYRGAGRQ